MKQSNIIGVIWCEDCSTYTQLEVILRDGKNICVGACNCAGYYISIDNVIEIGKIPVLTITLKGTK